MLLSNDIFEEISLDVSTFECDDKITKLMKKLKKLYLKFDTTTEKTLEFIGKGIKETKTLKDFSLISTTNLLTKSIQNFEDNTSINSLKFDNKEFN